MPDASDLVPLTFYFQKQDLLITFLVILLGIGFGNLRIKGVGFGASGVLIVAMVFGYVFAPEPVRILQNLGIVLFLLSVGLEAGPTFFRAFKQYGRKFIANVLALLGIAAVNTVAIIALSGVPIGIGLGLFAGAFTSSPALVSALQFSPESEVIFGYGVAYPFGLMGVILFISVAMQVLRPRMEAEVAARSQLSAATYRVDNPDFDGVLLRDIELFTDHNVVVSGILRERTLRTASGSTALLKGDVVRLEGRKADIETVGEKLGSAVEDIPSEDSELDTRSIVVENTSVLNRSISDLGLRLLFNVAVTRVVRNNVEFVPRHDLELAFGDVVVAVGTPYQLDQLEMYLGHEHQAVARRVDIGSLGATLFLAFAIGGIVVPMPVLGNFSLGIAGGALISGLVFGHFGKIGNFIGRFPRNATAVLKELGLALFFAQLGFETGQSFVEFLDFDAIFYAAYAVLLAVVPMAGSFLAGHYLLRIPVSECFGVICGGMTFTPGLDVIRQMDSSERPVVAYSSVYPVALILIIAVVQGMNLALVALGAGG
ncbi:putative transport protein [Limimonas halophila]|uniref:Putative transport protein n=1 Tax=Limimonas halophila TaxID=1082479 RepID=A0A1G7T2P0_9PROT|nr:TrkA C-terminal domain-containing protein [Limimonas halophila]SDG29607.1 putative transport protein [Limimonas halophila]